MSTETTREEHGHVEESDHEATHHPGPAEYVKIAVVLAVATALEVALYYLPQIPDGVVIGLLIFFMIAKFALVVLWFMHLKFDSRLLSRFFLAGLVLATSVYVVVLLSFGVFIPNR
ncbi:MAG: cytochrome C oxidase subunit IV family protein [Actinomycetota bacterium]|nr:cytochrome C oxidase subunit IV family protein [Actinomycetota bacterium]